MHIATSNPRTSLSLRWATFLWRILDLPESLLQRRSALLRTTFNQGQLNTSAQKSIGMKRRLTLCIQTFGGLAPYFWRWFCSRETLVVVLLLWNSLMHFEIVFPSLWRMASLYWQERGQPDFWAQQWRDWFVAKGGRNDHYFSWSWSSSLTRFST